MDIFGDDIDSFYNTDDALNENVREGDIEEAEEDNDADDENGGESKKDSHGEPIKVEPKKRSVRNPRVNTKMSFEITNDSHAKLKFVDFIADAFECGTIEIRPWNTHTRKLLQRY